jgi:hypothetical protein
MKKVNKRGEERREKMRWESNEVKWRGEKRREEKRREWLGSKVKVEGGGD